MTVIMQLENVDAGYGNKIVLRNIHFCLRQDDFVGVIGPNGGGKSTFLKLILNAIKPVSGSVHFPDGRKKISIGYLPQINLFDRDFPVSVLQVVLSGDMSQATLFRRFSPLQKQKAMELLAQMSIENLATTAIGDLSGGQLQRVLLCRALISSPNLLLLDEPDTFVDRNFEIDLYHILQDLNKKMAIVLVSHETGLVSSYVKSIACINETLYYHDQGNLTQEVLDHYKCPMEFIAHGEIPHRVLKKHRHH